MIRIEKYLSEQGTMSRREAKRFIESGDIQVNNQAATPGQKIDPKTATLSFSKKLKAKMEEKMTVLVYKPRGYISSKDTDDGENIFDVFPQFSELNTVGRLDKESEGLILLSNDGMITKAITGKDHLIEKEYTVVVREKITAAMMAKMSHGMKLEDGWTLPATAVKVTINSFNITLKEGRKHQIRRMANACRLTVESLKRVRIHTIRAPKMLPGNFKKLTPEQIEDLKETGAVTAKKKI
jgi:23S rRNA pseudouridine2604 synthase